MIIITRVLWEEAAGYSKLALSDIYLNFVQPNIQGVTALNTISRAVAV